ncbi:TlpA family protein disulfide reductase [Flavobacterium sp. J49]|uniref:TlpA family protein disulfide reductase n=1 Tax=Flavobacterium sp. J49 TaxID=2718534 RepID=UPI0015931BF0|nr:TlpA disulfide reductase family protein [Flavobacterium sp. J49]MBF6639910.1 TlpA family protein disulfide reductase [Flavobacterium sp. J49]NIC01155.1 TlpA family protein disulfide reductase [Flavobacterium sp. J49]
MKLLYSISIFFILTFASNALAQITVYEKFADFEKVVIKEDQTTYVINFWATWCAPCIKELPYFEQLHKENKKVKVLLVSLDSRKDLEKKLIPFVERKKISAEVLLLSDKDYNSWLSKIDKDWSGAIPATLLIQGKKHLFAEREFENFTELNEYVNSFINLN